MLLVAWSTSITFTVWLQESISALCHCPSLLVDVFREMNIQDCGYSAKWRWWLTAIAKDSRHQFSVIARTARCRRQKHRQRWPGNPKGQRKFCNYYAVLRNLHLRDHDWCSMVDGNGRCHGLIPLSSEEITRTECCRHQKHCRRWLGSIKIPQLSRILSKFMSTRSWLMLHGWQWLPDIISDDQVTPRVDRNSATIVKSFEIYAYQIMQSLLKIIFLLLGYRHHDALVQCYFLLSLTTAFVLTYEK